jgi:hypothetical protein
MGLDIAFKEALRRAGLLSWRALAMGIELFFVN